MDLANNDIREMPEGIFSNCHSLKELKLPLILQNISDNAFFNCSNLESIQFNNVLNIGKKALFGCSNISELFIPSSCAFIDDEAFGCMTSLKKIIFESGDVLSLGHSGLTLSSSVTPFPNPSDVDESRTGFRNGYYNGLFYGLPIEHLVINRDIELPIYYERTRGTSTSRYSIVYNDIVYYPPFYGLTNLKYLEIGENVSAICKNQIEAVVNAVPTTMNYTNFGKCDNIEVVVSNNPNAPIGGGFSQTVYENASLFLPNGGVESYKNDDYWKNFAHINETSFISVESISFESEDVTIGLNDSKTLHPIINPDEASIKTLKWSSSKPSIITVSEDGVITASSQEGEAIVSCTASDGSGVSAVCHVTVLPILAESITIEPTEWSGYEGESFSITATVLPENTTDPAIEWTSSNQSVATVDKDGLVSVQNPGNCVITAKTTDGSNLTADCIITSSSGINAIFSDDSGLWDVYNVAGSLIIKDGNPEQLRQLQSGIYIFRQGICSLKVLVR